MSDETQKFETSTPPVARASNSNPYLIPGAIIVAGLVIAGAIFAKGSAPVAPVSGGKTLEPQVLAVGPEDHVFGSAKPDVYLIEYSDYQCSFCMRFHETVKEVVTKYNGKVSWVYRHFPLDTIHPEARPAAVASECIAELGGNDAFWKYTDKIFEDQSAMSDTRYTAIAKELGIDEGAFSTCLTSGKYDGRVDRDLANGEDIGGQGTPFNVLLTKNGDVIKFSGALPIDRVTTLVDRALASVK
jgi:protein-disulfide isomerase